jgi:hypothetical protein
LTKKGFFGIICCFGGLQKEALFLKPINFGGSMRTDSRNEDLQRRIDIEQAVDDLREQDRSPSPGFSWDAFGLIISRLDQVTGNVLREQKVTDAEYARWQAAYDSEAPQRAIRQAIFDCKHSDIYSDVPVLTAYVDGHGLPALAERFGVTADEYLLWSRLAVVAENSYVD